MKNKLSRKVLGVILLLGFIFLFAAPVFAADTGIVPCGHDGKACTLCDLIKGFKILFDYGIKIIAVITLACATFAGVMYIVSSGNEGTMESAKKFLSASLIGFAVVLGAWVMVNTTIKVLMPTKTATDAEGFLGTGKTSWVDFGSVDCASSTEPALSLKKYSNDTTLTGTTGAWYEIKPFSITGGSGNYTWSAENLPADLKIDTSTGVISGMLNANAGIYIITVTATDLGAESVSVNNSANIFFGAPTVFAAKGDSASMQFELVVEGPDTGAFTIATPSPLPSGTVGSAYNASLSATGGSGSYRWSFTTEPGCIIPSELSISSAGVITGTPTTADTYSHVCTKVYSGGDTRFKDFKLVIAATGTPAPTLTLSAAINPVAYNTASTLIWTTTNATSCIATNGWTGSKTATGGSEGTGALTAAKTYSLECWNSAGVSTGVKAVTVNVNGTGGTGGGTGGTCVLTITSASPLSEGLVGSAYSESLSATGEGGTYVWSVLSLPGCVFPPGLTLSSGGIISGTPTKAGVYGDVCIRLSAGGCYNTSKSFVLLVKDAGGGLGDCECYEGDRTYDTSCVGNRKGTYTWIETCDGCHWGERRGYKDNCDGCVDGYHPYYTAAGMICRPN